MTPSFPSMPSAARAGWGWHHLSSRVTWTSLALTGIMLLATILRFANLDAIGQANTYYTAAVEAMLQSWHNFFFVAAEPGGSVSVDKPPVGLWLQVISAYFLGVNGFAVVLPQLLAGIGSVILVFSLVRRWFGNVVGLIAAFALAVTPVAIAVERNNTPDATLIFTLLLATWAFIKATETRKLRFLLVGAVLVGIGFNIKMLQALLPLPAFYALYVFGSQQGWWRKLWYLGVATLVLIPLALSWAVIVDLTPADHRPYVGGSENNSALNLIVGYNGVQRLLGNGPGGGRTRPNAAPNGTMQNQMPPAGLAQDGNGQRSMDGTRPDGGPGGRFGGAGGMFGTGNPGVLRLFQAGLAAQVSWLLPFGLVSIVALAASVGWRHPYTARHCGLILWGGWLMTCAVFFSVAGFFHQYYLAMMGAPLAALVAMGVVWVWRLRATQPVRAALVLLTAAGVTLAFQVYAVAMYQSLGWWVVLPVVLGGLGGAMLLLSLRPAWSAVARPGIAVLTAAILVVPTVWSGWTTAYADTSGPLPQAYTGNTGRWGMALDGQNRAMSRPMTTTAPPAMPPMGGGMGGMGGGVNQNLLNYLQAHTQDVKYLLVVPSSMQGAGYVLATGRPVLYAGGFGGSDPVIDGDDLATLVANGEVRYVLWGEGGGGPGGSTTSSITSYLQASCMVVDDASLGTSTSTTQSTNGQGGFGERGGASTLYKCGM
jgi:4-amino-4-deoxy-L-arabinose transferase-like glycosyltransferase